MMITSQFKILYVFDIMPNRWVEKFSKSYENWMSYDLRKKSIFYDMSQDQKKKI